MHNSRLIALVLAVAVPASVSVADPQAVLTRTAARQAEIKTGTQRAAKELSAIIAEYERNGMGDDADAKTLAALRGMLSTLSDRDMEQVIGLLQAAAKSGKGLAGGGDLQALDAYKGQRNIATELRLILIKYQRQIELADLSMQFGKLADRQDDNFKGTRALGQKAGVRTRLDDAEKITLQVQQSVQTGIKDEAVALLAKLLDVAAKTASDDPNAARLGELAEQVKKGELEKALLAAQAELNSASLYSAAASQRSARDQLRALSRLLSPKRDDMAVLEDAVKEIEKRIEEQKHLNGEAAKGDDPKSLEPKQGDVVDQTDQTKTDLATLAPDAAAALGTAMDNMQDARAPLSEGAPAAAQQPMADAVKNLEAAKAAASEKLDALKAAAEAAAAAAADPGAAGDPSAAAAAQMGAAAGAGMGMGMGQGMGMGMGVGMGMGLGMGPGMGMGLGMMANENMAMRGMGNRMSAQVNASSVAGPQRAGAGAGTYLGLPPRDRLAIEQSRSDRSPPEYAPQIEQYLKNLAQSEQ